MRDEIDELVEELCESVQFQKEGGEVYSDISGGEGEDDDEE